jgi:hypothetical protein
MINKCRKGNIMARRKKQLNLKKLLIGLAIIVAFLILLALIRVAKVDTANETNNTDSAKADFSNNQKQQILTDLSDMSEEERIEYYCGEFFKLLDREDYESAYAILYDEYKENFFPTYENFKKYIETYFPENFALSYQNIERLGDIYVLWISVKDTLNGSKYGHNFDMNVVIQENDYNDYVLSFSRDSAVATAEEEE